MSKVVLIRCESYEPGEVRAAVERGVDLLGGPSAFAAPGEKLLLKPNWLSADPPEKCVTTHPAVFRAVAELLRGAGASLTYGDSPAFQSPDNAAKRTGIGSVAVELGIEPADFRTGREVFYQEGSQNKRFTIAAGALDSDGLVSLPKMKTHGFQKVTGAVKNQFGCIPGPRKGEFHVRVPDAEEFARMLVDLNSFLHPRLYVMDGIMAMEGNGPRGGTPRKMNVLLFSTDPIALDATMCRLMNLDPELVLTNKAGMAMGAGTYRKGEIELLGDPIERFIALDYKVNRDPITPIRQRGSLSALQNRLVPKPYLVAEQCIRCGICVNMCPVTPKALDWHDGNRKRPPSYKYERCIRCYCCQELCPKSAIHLRMPLLRRLLGTKSES